MGFRLQKSIKLGGGFRLNLSKSGIGFSGGRRGARVGITSRGRGYVSLGIPGTGISNRIYLKSGKRKGGRGQNPQAFLEKQQSGLLGVSQQPHSLNDGREAGNTTAQVAVVQRNDPKRRHPMLWMYGAIIVFLFFAGRYLPTVSTPKVNSPSVAPAVEKPKFQWIEASDLCRNFKSSKAKADRDYKGRTFVIKGEVGAVGRDRIEKGIFAGVKPFVELNDVGALFALESIEAYVSKEDEKFLSKVKHGQPLALVCVVLGENSVRGTVEADHCRPAEESEIGWPVPNSSASSMAMPRSKRKPKLSSTHLSSSGPTQQSR